MKIPHFLLIITIISFSESLKAIETKKEGAPKVYGDVVINEDLKKLLSVNGVKEIYDECQKKKKELSEMANCIWEDPRMNPEKKKQVQAIYANEIKPKVENGRTPAGESKLSLTAREKTAGIDYASDPVVSALSEYYGKKLDQILAPTKEDIAQGAIVTVDHKKFIDLYKTELGKTIINAFTSYCMDSDPSTCCVPSDPICGEKTCTLAKDKEERIRHRQANMDSLSKANFSDGSLDARKWNKCITDVPKACHSASIEGDSKQRACLIVDYVKAARKNIIIVDKQEEFYKSFQNTSINIASNMKIVDDEKKASADAILEMTSKDVKDTLKAPTERLVKESEQCLDKNEMIADVERCKKFLNINKTANESAVTEYGLRQLAQEETLKEELNSKERVQDYLKEEGFRDNEIQKLTENDKAINETKDQIIARYKAEKAAIIQEMAKRIDGKTANENGTITGNSGNLDKIKDIQNQLKNRGDDLGNLIKFNNIVSSYLSISEGNNKTSRNTASLFAEIREDQEMQKAIKDAGLTDKKNSANLNVDTINDAFLDYDKPKN